MNKSSQIAVGVLITIVIIGAIWYGVTRNHNAPVAAINNTTQTTATNSNTTPATAANSDATINQDTQAIDSQMNGLNSDNSNTQQSMGQQ